MPIDVKPPSRQLIDRMTTRFALQRDDWNDYSFRTLYHLHYRHGPEDKDVTYVGPVKILRKGQTSGGPQLIREPFNKLTGPWVSVGSSLDYYQRLNELPERWRTAIMIALNDAVANPSLVSEFENEEGWRRSLFRDNSEWSDFLSDARILFEGNFGALPDLATTFSFRPVGAEEPIVFDFDAPEPDFYMGPWNRIGPRRKKTLLPNRLMVLVGQNGSGKSTLLSRLAHVAFASPQDRASKRLKVIGALEPPSIGFMRIITISYSAFDSFVVPGLAAKELSQATEDLESGDGRFIFCGLRDLVAEARADVSADQEKADDDVLQPLERRTTTCLKPVEVLAQEFADLIGRIRREERIDLFEAAVEPLLRDPSFAEHREQIARLTSPIFTRRSARALFLGWSTGHKIALHVVACLVAHSRPRSLVLFDEPEAHLHPPLMAALMHSVRLVLTDVNAFCVAATHSPVLLQETLSRHVRRVQRTGSVLTVSQPGLETFGENVGMLTYDAFGLTASTTDYHQILDLLVEGCDTVEEVEALFETGLSMQARAYVFAKFAEKQ
ncbi:AAA family ATPase [Rhizobium leguminosarum]|uniref:AAA family ATPase n=1 Tax=Rhizobium leguminosarum TaxID=384 RepID=UPI001C978D06|nr:AAA family ATPase [Rhizobium leguminosarum]MBY5448107.1 AAA family ATPase [Rhizobium leguminosarum]